MKKLALRCMVGLACLSSVSAGILTFTTYRSPSQVDAALNSLNTTYPTWTRVITIGTSIEGRPIKALKISSNPMVDDPAKGDVVFVGLHHAREWITVEMALYLADELLARRTTDAELGADMNQLQIWIVPVMNPDGFQHTVTSYRYWRKNRRNNGDGTFGVDLNRNWGYQWGLLSGSSAMTANDTYHGSAAFSEPETSVIRDLLLNRQNLKAFVSYHSYSELFLRPWGYTTSDPPGESTVRSIAQRSISRIASVHGHTYSENIGYTASGEATDYVWNQMRSAPFTPELRPDPVTGSANGGLAGFSPPASTILPNNEENLPAALALIHDAARTGVWIKDYASDVGAEPSAVWTPSGWSHAFWESPDITTVPTTLNQGATVDLNIRVRNNTGSPQNNVTVEAYYTDPRISLEFPNPAAVLIGTRNITVPPPGATTTMPWTVPMGANSWGELHWCVGVVIKHDRDMPLTTQVNRSSNVGCRNFNTAPLLASQFFLVTAQNFLNVPAELQVLIDNKTLPDGWKARVAQLTQPPVTNRLLTATERKAKLLGVTGQILEPGQSVFIPVRVSPPDNVQRGAQAEVRIHGGLLPMVPGKREAVGNGFTFQVVADKP